MKVGVVVFPGSNCDHDTLYSVQHFLHQEAVALWHKDTDLQGCDVIFLPGGFSYGDYLRSGAIARFSPIMNEVIRFAQGGGYVVGICNGFQILCESGLLSGALLLNTNQKFNCKNVYIKPQTARTVITRNTSLNKAYKIPIAHGEGRYYADAETLQQLNDGGQVLFRYCDEQGNVTLASNPNGSVQNIAGVCNAGRNVFGMMPHPERAVDPLTGNVDGLAILEGLLSLESA